MISLNEAAKWGIKRLQGCGGMRFANFESFDSELAQLVTKYLDLEYPKDELIAALELEALSLLEDDESELPE